MTYRIDIYQDGVKVAGVESSSAYRTLELAATYAAQYEDDGPVTLKVKNPKAEKAK